MNSCIYWQIFLSIPEHLAAAGFHTIDAKFDSTSKPFLNLVPTRLTIADARENFHVPLLVTLGLYLTYRGS